MTEKGDVDLLLVGMNSIGGKVDELCISMEYVKGELIRNEEWHKRLNDDVKDIHSAVHGNGKPGLTKELQCIDDAVADISRRLTAIETERRERDSLRTTSKLEWLRGWRAVFFTGATVLISTAITLSLGHYFGQLTEAALTTPIP
jgi:hypothetical protein